MSKDDFHDRLNRIGAPPQAQHYAAEGMAQTAQSSPPRQRTGLMFLGLGLVGAAVQTFRYANQNYETLRDDTPEFAIVLFFGAIIALLLGVIMVFRAAPRGRKRQVASARQASPGTRIFQSLLGFFSGATTLLLLYMDNAASRLGTAAAERFVNSSNLIIVALVLVSLGFGFVGLLRGRTGARVPLYFLFGALVVYWGFRLLRIHPAHWPQFMALLQ